MPEFHEVLFFIVRKMAAVRKRPGGYELLTDKGIRLGELEANVRNPLQKLMQAIGSGVGFARRIQVIDSKGKTLCTVHKPLSYGKINATIRSPDGKVQARIRQIKREMGLSGHRFEVTSVDGKLLGSMVGDWKSWNIQIFDGANSLLGKISKKAENVSRVIYADVDHFAIELTRPIPGERTRLMLLAAASTLELIMT